MNPNFKLATVLYMNVVIYTQCTHIETILCVF